MAFNVSGSSPAPSANSPLALLLRPSRSATAAISPNVRPPNSTNCLGCPMRELHPPINNPPYNCRPLHARGSHSLIKSRKAARRSPSHGNTRNKFATSAGGALSPLGAKPDLRQRHVLVTFHQQQVVKRTELAQRQFPSGSSAWCRRRSNCSSGPRRLTVAPARKSRSLSLPWLSTWKPCASCLMAATRSPRATSRGIAASSSVVLPRRKSRRPPAPARRTPTAGN